MTDSQASGKSRFLNRTTTSATDRADSGFFVGAMPTLQLPATAVRVTVNDRNYWGK